MKKNSIRRFSFFYLIFAVTLPLLFLGSTGLIISLGILKEELSEANNIQVNLIGEMIKQYLTIHQEEMDLVMTLLDNGINPGENGLNRILQSITESHEHILGIQFSDRIGTILSVYPKDDSIIGTDISGHKFFREAIEKGKPYWAPSFMSEQTDTPVTSLSIPYENGVITSFISLSKIGKFTYNNASENLNRMVFITDQTGVFIAHPEEEKVSLRVYDPYFIYNRNLWTGLALHQIVIYDGEEHLSHVIFLPDTGWKIALYQPFTSFNAPVKVMAFWLAVLTILSTFIAVFFGNRFNSSISHSLNVLVDSTKNLAEGNYQLALPSVKFRELSQLAESFKLMTNNIKNREEDLKKTKTYISSIIDSMPSILVGVDSDGNVTQWNMAAVKKTEINADTAMGRILSDVLPHMASEMNIIKDSIRTHKIKIDTKKVHKLNTHTLYEEITIYPLILNGVEGAVIRIDDITDKVQMEEMMIQSEKMLSLGGLAAGMAHEINNPLAGIMQTASVMKNRLIDIDMPANKRIAEEIDVNIVDIRNFMDKRGIPSMIETINESGKRVSSIVENMLSFARKIDDIRSSHDIDKLMEKTIELATTDYNMKKHYNFKQIKIIREYAENLPIVPCDYTKIQQVILNILRNGAQAMNIERVKRSQFIIRIIFDKDKNMVIIEIEDNGPGMEEKIRKRIFEPFFTTKPVGKGTGLGLSVSYFIITENHGGKISVESRLGIGTKFLISLPIEEEKYE